MMLEFGKKEKSINLSHLGVRDLVLTNLSRLPFPMRLTYRWHLHQLGDAGSATTL